MESCCAVAFFGTSSKLAEKFKNMKTKLTFLLSCLTFICLAQIGGNQLYGGNNSSNSQLHNLTINNAISPKIQMSKDALSFEVNILNNVRADVYVVTLGVNEENTSVEACNTQINQRIENFMKSISKIGIKKSDVYVDFISQTKIYDYVSDSEGERIDIQQVDVGFEIKKNIIFKLSRLELFDKILELASKEKIHNIINVEYYVENQNAIYEEMLKEAMKIQKERLKLLNLNESDWEMEPMISINFSSVQPGHQYKKFQAYESGTVSYSNYYNNNSVIVRKEERKSNSFYFDGLDSNSFDKILNASSPVVGLQFLMNLKITYVKKEKEKKNYYIVAPNGELKALELN